MNIKLELSIDEVNLLIAGLGKLPLEASVGVWAKVKHQTESQIKEVETPKE